MKKTMFIFAFMFAMWSGVASAQDDVNTQEYIFITSNGGSFTQILSKDWSPEIKGGFMRINNRARFAAMDVIMIRPRVQWDINGLVFVRLARRNESVARAGLFDLWVRDGVQELLGTDHSADMMKVAPQTWLRPNDFRLLIERQTEARLSADQ